MSPDRKHHPGPVFAAFALCYSAVWASAAALTDWGAYWLAWIFAGFVVPELYAVARKIPIGPLSDNYWSWERLDFGHPFDFSTWPWQHWVLAAIVWLLFGWLSLHLPFGLLRG